MEFIVVEAAQIDAVALVPAFGQTEHAHEEIEALFGLVGEKFDMAKMGDVEAGLGCARHCVTGNMGHQMDAARRRSTFQPVRRPLRNCRKIASSREKKCP